MLRALKILLSFLKKDFQNAISYKLQFISSLFAILFGTFIFFTFSKLFENANSPLLQEYNNNYFAFSLIGLALTDFTFYIAKSINQEIRNGQLNGTFEELILASKNHIFILISIVSYPVVYGLLRLLFFLLIGIFIFNLEIEIVKGYAYIPLILVLTILSYLGIALISASYTIIFKSGDPFNSLFFTISGIFGGVIYPVKALPEISIFISNFLPITYILESLRACLIQGNEVDINSNFISLSFISLFFMTAGCLLCILAIKRAKKTGSLIYY
jgi:ABC-2 type transport system permease protein